MPRLIEAIATAVGKECEHGRGSVCDEVGRSRSDEGRGEVRLRAQGRRLQMTAGGETIAGEDKTCAARRRGERQNGGFLEGGGLAATSHHCEGAGLVREAWRRLRQISGWRVSRPSRPSRSPAWLNWGDLDGQNNRMLATQFMIPLVEGCALKKLLDQWWRSASQAQVHG